MGISSRQRFIDAASNVGVDPQVREFPEGTKTAVDAARAVGCELAAIVKSLVFMVDDQAVLVLTSGSNRVDEQLVGTAIGGVLERADANTVRSVTGFAVGGVPPFGHDSKLTTYIDRDLLSHPQVWAAAGDAHSVFPLEPKALAALTDATVIKVT